MAFSIKADFRLGFFQGHGRDGGAERHPDILRLFSAFDSAAYSLAAYQSEDDLRDGFDKALHLPNEFAQAICWFESNPPDAIVLPGSICSKSHAVAFRKLGCLDTDGKSLKKPRAGVPAVSRSFLDGPISWYWAQDKVPDERLTDALRRIANEVPYLGESSSPVAISIMEDAAIPENAYRLCDDAGPDCYRSRYPRCGAANCLEAFFAETEKRPGLKDNKDDSDKEFQTGEAFSPRSPFYEYAYYRPSENGSCLPWRQGILLKAWNAETGEVWEPAQRDWLKWAEAFHRALVKVYGGRNHGELPGFLNGRSRSANNLAIQVIPKEYGSKLSFTLPGEGCFILLMLPRDASWLEIETLRQKLANGFPSIYLGKHGKINVAVVDDQMDLSSFWCMPAPGTKRLWSPEPLYVSDNRKPSSLGRAAKWTLADSLLLSLGYVFRDFFDISESGDRGRVELLREVADKGAKAVHHSELPIRDPYDYIHRMNKGSLFTAGSALVDLGELTGGCDTFALAVGQSRHFSGGFLVPVDIAL